MDKRTITKIEKTLADNDWSFDGTNIVDSDNDVVKVKIVAKMYGTTEQSMGALLMEYAEEKKPKQKSSDFDDTFFKEVLNSVLIHKGYELDIATMGFKKVIIGAGGKSYSISVDEDELRTQITNSINVFKMNKDIKFSTKDVLVYKDAISLDMLDKKLAFLLSEISYNGSNISDIFFTRMHKAFQITQDLDIFITLMKHFVWQIKRRITEQSTYNDIMISIFGNQGIGKSYLINAIFGKLLGGFYNASISISNLLDERWTRALNTQFLMNIEELDAGGDRINGQTMATLKKYLTGKEATYRPMGTNTTKTVAIKTSFISTANYHIYKVLSDETGMRRFFEFTSGINRDQRISEEDSKWLEDNALDMFCSIDENKSKGYWDTNNEIGLKITAIQRTYVNDSASRFLESTYKLAKNMKAKDGLKLSDIYTEYLSFCEHENIETQFRKKINNFAERIEHVFGLDITKTLPGKNKSFLLVKKDKEDLTTEQEVFNAASHFVEARQRKQLNSLEIE